MPPPSPLSPLGPDVGGRYAGTGEVDLGGWLTRGWETIKDDIMTFAVATLLAGLVGTVTCGILAPAMNCGIMMLVLRKMLYGRVEIGNVFDGMKRFVPALLAGLLILCASMVIQAVSSGPMYAVMAITSAGAQTSQAPTPAFFAAQAWSYVAGTILGAMLSGATFFVFAHIAARNVGPVDALQASWEIFRRNIVWFTLLGFVYQLISGLGILACCVGIFVTAPLVLAATVHAYIDHFGMAGVSIEE